MEWEPMGIKRARIELPAADRLDSIADALHVNSAIALVRADNVEPAPVPKLHIHLPEPILVIARNDQSSPLFGQLPGKIERPLLTRGFDHDITEFAVGKVFHF